MLIKAYHPITLLNTIEKTFESVLARKICRITKIYHFLPNTYSEKRKNTLIEHVVYFLIEITYTALDRKEKVLALILDITGTFDDISQIRLIHNLQKQQLDSQIISQIASFIQNRNTIITRNKCLSNLIYISTRIPKDLFLLPILYLFYKTDFLEIQLSSNSHIFAKRFINDTIVLLAISSSITKNCKLVKKCTNYALIGLTNTSQNQTNQNTSLFIYYRKEIQISRRIRYQIIVILLKLKNQEFY